MTWFVEKVLPGLIDAIPFVLIVGFGLHFHLRGVRRANRKQTAQIIAKTDEQTEQIVQSLRPTLRRPS